MINRRYNIASILKDMIKNLPITLVILVLCTILGAAAGFVSHKRDVREAEEINNALTSENYTGDSEEIEAIRSYEEALKSYESALEMAIKQRDEKKAYMDNSILMKIDSENIYTVNCSYAITDTDNANDIIQSYLSYLIYGGLRDELEEENKDLNVEAWMDVLQIGGQGNSLNIVLSHYDPDQANEIMSIIMKRIENKKADIAAAQGSFTLKLVDNSSYTRIDPAFTDKQIGNTNALRTYENAVVDQTNALEEYKSAVKKYKIKNGVDGGTKSVRSLAKTLVIYTAAGIIGGLFLSFTLFVCLAVFGAKIRDIRYIDYSGICLWNFGNSEDIDKLKAVLDKNAVNCLAVFDMRNTSEGKEIINLFTEKGIDSKVKLIQVSENDYNSVLESEACLALVKRKKNTYIEVEKYKQFCEKLNIKDLGLVEI